MLRGRGLPQCAHSSCNTQASHKILAPVSLILRKPFPASLRSVACLRSTGHLFRLGPCSATASDGSEPSTSDARVSSNASGASGIYNSDITSAHSISFAEPAAGPSTTSKSSSSSSGTTADGFLTSSGRSGQHLLSSSSPSTAFQIPSPSGSDHPHQPQQHTTQHTHGPSSPLPGMTSYSEYYRQLQLQQLAERGPQPPPLDAASPTSLPSPSTSAPPVQPSPATTVAEALSRAQQALDKVESSLEAIDQLPSAQPEPPSNTLLATARTALAVAALTGAVLASHAFGLVIQWLSAVLCGAGIAVWGYKRGSLSRSGAVAAAAVGLSTLGCSLRLGITLLAFFFSSSKLTQYKEEIKSKLDDHTKKGGQRDWVQVFCNALVPTVLAIVYGVLAGCVDVPLGPLPSLEPWRSKAMTGLMGGFLGYYACCCGDTWASELGPLSADTPRLITTLRPVRRGTNGGVTLLGLSASILGGAFVGAIFYAAAVVSPTLFIFEQQHMVAIEQWKLIPLGLVAGLLGSVLDSVLGATVQYSGYNGGTGRVTSSPGPGVQHISGLPYLSNNAVNAVSATATSAITALAALKAFGF